MSLKRKAGEPPTSDSRKPKSNATITSFFQAPKPTATTATVSPGASLTEPSASTTVTPTPVKFDKAAWVAKLTAEQKDLLGLEIETLHESWLKELKDEILTKDFLELKKFLKKEHDSGKKIFPPAADVYSWLVLPETRPRRGSMERACFN